jgi:hypothetical protein
MQGHVASGCPSRKTCTASVHDQILLLSAVNSCSLSLMMVPHAAWRSMRGCVQVFGLPQHC